MGRLDHDDSLCPCIHSCNGAGQHPVADAPESRGRHDSPDQLGVSGTPHLGAVDGVDDTPLFPDETDYGVSQPMNRRLRRTLAQNIRRLEDACSRGQEKKAKAAEAFVMETLKWGVGNDQIHGEGFHDVSEVFSQPRMVLRAGQYGLLAGNSYDLVLGDDLLRKEHRSRVMRELARDKPFCVMVSPPCTMFSQQRRPGNPEEDREKIKEALTLMKFAVEVCQWQHAQKKFFILEQPQGAKSWGLKDLKGLVENPGCRCVDFDMCMYGLCDVESGMPHRKTTRIVTNIDEDIVGYLQRRCDGNHQHQVLEGQVKTEHGWMNRTRLAQVYPKQFCDAVCKCIQKQKRRFLSIDHDHDGLKHGCGDPGYHDVFVNEDEYESENKDSNHDMRRLVATVRKAHNNLGHPSPEKLCLVLKSAGASKKGHRGGPRD